MRAFLSLAAATLAACASAPARQDRGASTEAGPVELIFTGANVVTLDPARPRAAALAIAGGRIAALADDAAGARALVAAAPGARVVDLAGATVVPGLTDAHAHLFGIGTLADEVDLLGARSVGEALERVRAFAAAAPPAPGAWLQGRGWDQNDWPGARFPTAAELDAAVGDRPAALRRVDGHALWASSAALRLAGIGPDTADPPGGRILRGGDGRTPSGVLVDNAADLVFARIPPPDEAVLRRRAEEAMRRCAAVGLTAIHDAGAAPAELAVLRALEREGKLRIRIYAMAAGPGAGGTEASLAPVFAQGPALPRAGRGGALTVRAVKLILDGALGSRGAALKAPYADEPSQSGLLLVERDAVRRVLADATKAGFQVALHAIGDRANALALDAIEASGAAAAGLRPRLEHAQVLDLADLPRLKALGAIASMQPTHATSDMPWAEARVGAGRIAGAYAWRTLLRAGVPLAGGSDAPVESEDPRLGLYAAMTRQDLAGQPAGGWRADERLGAEEALRLFTTGAAWAAFEEDTRGVIAPGRLADLTVLAESPLDVRDARRIPDIPVVFTVVGGVIAHEAAGR